MSGLACVVALGVFRPNSFSFRELTAPSDLAGVG
jgi:hypothetical protein